MKYTSRATRLIELLHGKAHQHQPKPQPVRYCTVFTNPNPQRTPERARLERVK